MTPAATLASDEGAIREVLGTWAAAVGARDVDRIMVHYAPDLVAFDAVLGLRFEGRDAYRKHWQACLGMCPGTMIFEVRDQKVAVRDDLAFSYGLARCGVVDADGQEKASWMRATVYYRRIRGEWRIVHEHWSAPFDPETGKALFGLQP